MNYVRSHDDIGWTFADEDAAELGINGFDHRRFLNSFYVDRFPGSFARGVPFQDNPRTGDCRISGTTASLCGLEDGDARGRRTGSCWPTRSAFSTGGIPLLYLGDEVGQLNDYGYAAEDGHGDGQPLGAPAAASRRRVRAAPDPDPRRGRSVCRAAARRRSVAATPELAGTRLVAFATNNPGVLGYQRPGKER